MELEEKIKLLAEHHIFGIRKLTRLGGSYAITIPRIWVEMHCVDIEDDYYFSLELRDDNLILSPLQIDDIKAVNVRGKK